MVDITVRALEWAGGVFAHTKTGMLYHIIPSAGGFVLSKHQGDTEWKSFHDCEDAAKAAAQADYEQRIFSELIFCAPRQE